jgi:citrate lyase beta subunit
MQDLPVLRSILFVPGDRADRFAKAIDAKPSAVCIDLEDSVAQSQKSGARATVLDYLSGKRSPILGVRMNPMSTYEGMKDLLGIVDAAISPELLFLPKVSTPAEVKIAESVLQGRETSILPIIETVEGFANAGAIAAIPAVKAMLFGGGDLSAELGAEMSWEPLLVARCLFVQACARGGIQAIDVPHLELTDMTAVENESRRVKALGFTGKAAVHPAQVAVINAVFQPSDVEIAEAREAMDLFDAAGGGAVSFRGKMLDAPIVQRYRRILADDIR